MHWCSCRGGAACRRGSARPPVRAPRARAPLATAAGADFASRAAVDIGRRGYQTKHPARPQGSAQRAGASARGQRARAARPVPSTCPAPRPSATQMLASGTHQPDIDAYACDLLAEQAVKMGIPIVSEHYLLARLKAGREIGHEPYLMQVWRRRSPPPIRLAVALVSRGVTKRQREQGAYDDPNH